ncbi:PREDICTED: uncharacterized protein LOC101302630 [Fragaria vesca subsp. vesca]|uniref:uncharacterized protein LOC101302630 n=1 Tax=Fragaria vesca subsp. vesca TaxID=101020 RepID=UPI0002C3278A|nr:PREDICTED: uncharacterized protein LOC101302630 [Fragaria vesca subsp. vesca]
MVLNTSTACEGQHEEEYGVGRDLTLTFNQINDLPYINREQRPGEQFTQWAFTTLCRLLYFLNTGKPKKLTKQSRRDLRNLWEELQVFKFDLSWVEDDFITALGMKDEVERAKKLREEMNTLDTQRKSSLQWK